MIKMDVVNGRVPTHDVVHFPGVSDQQCTLDCIAAAIYTWKKRPDTWKGTDLDVIVNKSTLLYQSLIKQNETVHVNNIPKNVHIYGDQFQITQCLPSRALTEPGYETCLESRLRNLIVPGMWNCLLLQFTRESDKKEYSCLLIANVSTNVYLFDPHSTNIIGQPTEYGTCTLMYSYAIENCIAQICKIVSHHRLTQYKIIPIVIENTVTKTHIEDEIRKFIKRKEDKKKEDNKMNMRRKRQETKLAREKEVNSISSNDPHTRSVLKTRTVLANRHQGDAVYKFSGRQCMTNCAVSLILAHRLSPALWNTAHLDNILYYGDCLYKATNKDELLSPTDIPRHARVFNRDYIIYETGSTIGAFKSCGDLDYSITLSQIDSILKASSYFIFCMHDTSFSIIKDSQNIYHIFDPHSRDTKGLPCPDGKAIALTFASIQQVKAHIKTLHVHLNCLSSSTCHFEISPFNIFEDVPNNSHCHTYEGDGKCINKTTTAGSLGVYFADQRQKDQLQKEHKIEKSNSESLAKRQRIHPKTKHDLHVNENAKKGNPSSKCVRQQNQNDKHHMSRQSKKLLTSGVDNASNKQLYVNMDSCNHTNTPTLQSDISPLYESDAGRTSKSTLNKTNKDDSGQSEKRGKKRKYRADPEMYAKERERNAAAIKRRRTDDNTVLQNHLKQNKSYKKQKRLDQEYKDHEHYMKKCKKIELQSQETLQDAIKRFHDILKNGCMYVCTVCQQTNFYEYMSVISSSDVGDKKFLNKCITGYKSFDDKEYICNTCKREIQKNVVPKLSIINKCGFPQKPPELNINQLEEICVSPLIPFMTLRQLPRGLQKAIKGNVCHIPIEIGETLDKLPRTYSDMHTVPVDLKRRHEYKSSVCSENIRPTVIVKAAKYLVDNSEMYKHRNIHIDPDWLARIEMDTNNPYIQSDNRDNPKANDDADSLSSGSDNEFVEVDENIRNAGNKDTMLQNDVTDVQSLRYTFAPGEGKVPVFNEPLAEYLCFPTIFCGQSRPDNSERLRPVHVSDIFKYELRNVDERVCLNIPNIFWKAKHLQVNQMLSKVSLAVRRNTSKGNKKITAALLCDETERNNLVKCDEGFHIFRTVRSSPAYFEGKKKELLAMVRQLGIPTFFFSLSSADTNWPSLLKCLGKLVDKKDYSDDYIENEMTWVDKNRLVASHPAICCRFFNYRVNKFFTQLICGHHNPLGTIKDYFWRVEFQQRGSPHIHGVLWVQDAPKFGHDDDAAVCAYIDKHISCSSKVSKEDSKWVSLQTHKHSKSCKRRRGKKEVCRFGVPWPPMRSTQILYPLEKDESIDHDYYAETYLKICQYLSSLGSDPPEMSFDDLLSNLCITEEIYITSICSSLRKPKVFLKRDVCDVRLNPYMKDLVSAWQANHDIQYVLDAYSCVVYICDYMTKSQKGISTVMAEACKETKRGNYSIKNSVRHMANKFLNASETSIMECCYDILQLPITYSTRKREFISTCKQEDRIFIAKSNKVLKNLPPTSTDVKLSSNIDKYVKRPKELSSWCLADFVAELDISYEKTNNRDSDCEDEDEQECLSESEELEICDQKQHSDDTMSCVFPLKKNGLVYKKRQKRKVIRFVNYRLGSDSENYYREKLLLYTSWRNEEELLNNNILYADAFKLHESTIKHKMTIYEPLSAILDEAIEEVHIESSILDDINPSMHEPDDHVATSHHSTYDYFDPDRPEFQRSFDIGVLMGCPSDKFVDSTKQRENYMADEDYKEVLRSLNKEQQEFYTHIMHLASTSDEQVTCCLHGGAGTGKSHVIKALYQGLYRLLCTSPGENPDICKIMIVAPTGRAAYNVNGSTIHSVFHIPVNQKVVYKPLPQDLQNSYRSRYQNLQWLIIDEISMVGERTHNFLECRLRELKQSTKPYGGVNIVAIGDFYQLKPVQDNYIFHEPTEGYAILSENLWRKHFRFFNLTEIMRQKDDKKFAEVLNRIRVNKHTVDDINMIKTRNITASEAAGLTHIPRFFPTRKMVDDYNASQRTASTNSFTSVALDILPANITKQMETILCKKIENRKKAETTAGLSKAVELTVDEQFDIIANINVADGLLNGTQCRIRHIQKSKDQNQLPDIVWVTFVEGDGNIGHLQRVKYHYLNRIFNKPESWTPIFAIRRTYTVDNQTVTRIQFPLRHAAARTIHVAQGGTYDSIVINLDTVQKPPSHWWEHVHYVALSRVTRLEGLNILGLNESRIRASHQVTQYLEDECASNASLCYTPLYTVKSPSLKIVYNNVGSLRHKIEDIKGNYNMMSADIICIAETWLHPHQMGTSYDIPHYKKYCTDLIHGYHGLMMYISDKLDIVHMAISASRDIETITVTVKQLGSMINIVALYCAPKVSHGNICKTLRDVLSTVNPHVHTILVGDFNVDVSGNKNSQFVNTMKIAFNMTQLITQSTTHEQTIIDLVFSNKACNYTQALTNYWSEHKIISILVNI